MSSYVLKNIINQIKSQLQNIDGGSSYNYTLNHNYIFKKFMALDSVGGYPSVCIASAKTSSIQTDQVSSDISVEAELFAYVKDTSPFDAIMNLCQDIEKCIFENETLGDCNVWELVLTFDLATLDDFGVALITLTAKTVYEKII